MPKIVEVDEEELLRLRRVGATIGKIAQHPEAVTLLEQAHKFVDPEAPTPALTRKRELEEPVTKVRAEFEAYKKEQAELTAKRETDARIKQLVDSRETALAKLRREGWTDEGIKAVEKLMDEKGLLDPQDAIDLYEKRHPPQVPATPTGGTGAWGYGDMPSGDSPDENFVKKLLETKGEKDFVVDRQAALTLQEMRGGRAR